MPKATCITPSPQVPLPRRRVRRSFHRRQSCKPTHPCWPPCWMLRIASHAIRTKGLTDPLAALKLRRTFVPPPPQERPAHSNAMGLMAAPSAGLSAGTARGVRSATARRTGIAIHWGRDRSATERACGGHGKHWQCQCRYRYRRFASGRRAHWAAARRLPPRPFRQGS